jgi:hypothetical protein
MRKKRLRASPHPRRAHSKRLRVTISTGKLTEHERVMKIAERLMREHDGALRELAKR